MSPAAFENLAGGRSKRAKNSQCPQQGQCKQCKETAEFFEAGADSAARFRLAPTGREFDFKDLIIIAPVQFRLAPTGREFDWRAIANSQ